MQTAAIILITVMLVIFGAVLFLSGTRDYITRSSPLLLLNARNKDSIEYSVRRAAKLYPGYTIYIVNRSPDPEMRAILTALNKDMDNVIIINPPGVPKGA